MPKAISDNAHPINTNGYPICLYLSLICSAIIIYYKFPQLNKEPATIKIHITLKCNVFVNGINIQKTQANKY